MASDYAIVHLSDLHFPKGGETAWASKMLHAFERLAKDSSLVVRGIAVTGDLVDSPNAATFGHVAKFLKKAAVALGLPEWPDKAWHPHVWVVDGNHDTRRFGTLPWFRKKEGVSLGGHIARHDTFVDTQSGILALGLNSSEHRLLARGYVPDDALQKIKGKVESHSDLKAVRYRVALLHHHLIPLPAEPLEMATGMAKKVRSVLFDPGFKLLDNAALVARNLIESGFDIVLHGHEHQSFAGVLNHIDDRCGRMMAVVGGMEAKSGFQVLKFRSEGDAVVVRHRLGHNGYEADRGYTLWDVDQWRRLEWERESRENGYYGKLVFRKEINAVGDLLQVMDVEDIHAPENGTIGEVPFGMQTVPVELGAPQVLRARSKSGEDLSVESSVPGEFPIPLSPPARSGRPHSGVEVESKLHNAFAVTKRDADYRDGAPAETTTAIVTRPVKRLLMSVRFPEGAIPVRISTITAENKVTGEQDHAETARIGKRVFFDPHAGIALLDIEHALPRFSYTLKWPLPVSIRADDDDAISGALQVKALLDLSAERREVLDTQLGHLRDTICRRLGAKSGLSAVDAALWAFDTEINRLRIVGGTYVASSPQLGAGLPWGKNAQGASMRRRAPYYAEAIPASRDVLFQPLDGCLQESHLLCVPIPVPLQAYTEPEKMLRNHAIPCVMLSLGTCTGKGHLTRLRNYETCQDVSSEILMGVWDIFKAMDL